MRVLKRRLRRGAPAKQGNIHHFIDCTIFSSSDDDFGKGVVHIVEVTVRWGETRVVRLKQRFDFPPLVPEILFIEIKGSSPEKAVMGITVWNPDTERVEEKFPSHNYSLKVTDIP